MSGRRPEASRVFLVRHGQDVDNSRFLINGRRDTPLTEDGRAQALAVADGLRSENIRRIYASPLLRARETAEIIARRLDISDVAVDAGLIERDYGELTGRSPSEIPELARRVVVAHGFRYVVEASGIEPYPQLWDRAGKALARVRAGHSGGPVLIVSHNEIIKMMRANHEGLSWEDEIRRPPLENGEIVVLD